MKLDDQLRHKLSHILLTAGVVLALIIVVATIHSLIAAFRGPAQTVTTILLPATVEPEPVQPTAVIPAPPPLLSTSDAAAPNRTQRDPGREFRILEQRKEAHKETIRVLRKEAQENPDSAPSEEQIKQMEKTGAVVI